jgi:hypothetical protein
MAIIDLDALTNPEKLPRVKLYGREIVVRPLTGMAAHRVAAVQSSNEAGAEMMDALLSIVRSSCPELTSEEVNALSIEQVSALVQLSRNQVDAVEQMLAEMAEKN